MSSESEPEPDKPAMSLYKSGPRTPQQHLTASGSGSHMPATSLMPLSPEQELENGASSDEVSLTLVVKQFLPKSYNLTVVDYNKRSFIDEKHS